MSLDSDQCRAAVIARDPRFDGVFYVAVETTGIYCRPVCPARTPRADRCRYFAHAAQAEAAGFRACLRCRPEVAPGRGFADAADVDARAALVRAAVAAIDRGFLVDRSQDDLAAHLGVTARHLRRAIADELGVTPGQLDRTRRFAVAKQLLHDSSVGLAEVGLAAGFGSVRRWNAAFRAQFATTPSAFRQSRAVGGARAGDDGALVLRLDARPPFAGRALCDFLAARAIAGVEQIAGGEYRRTVELDGHRGTLSARVVDDGARPGVRLAVSASLAPRLLAVVGRIRGLFDLDAQPAAIAAHLGADPRLAAAIAREPGRRVPGAFDGFEVAVRTILGQQVSVAAATTLCARLVAQLGAPIATPWPGLDRVFPTAAVLAGTPTATLAAISLPAARADAIRALARAAADGAIALEPTADPAAAMAALVELPGIGPWTASYLAMRVLRWPDGFPAGDLVIRRALDATTDRAAERASAPWRPWRAYAAMHLWANAHAGG